MSSASNGWRACIDHIIRPDSPCPVCEIERLTAKVEAHKDFFEHLVNNLYGNPDIDQKVMAQWIIDHLEKQK